MTLFEPQRSASKATDQPAAVERESNISGGLRKMAMVVAIGGLVYLALRRSRSGGRSAERIRNRVAAAVETRDVRTDGSTESGQPEPGGVGVPSDEADGDSGSLESSGAEAREAVAEPEPADDQRRDVEPVDDEPVEGAETAVDEMDDAHEHPTEPGTMDVDRDVVEEAVDDDAVDEEALEDETVEDEDESTKEPEE